MFVIKVRGTVFKLIQNNKIGPTIYYFETYKSAQDVIENWDKLHSTFNHSISYNYKKDKKGKDVCEYVYTRLETIIEETNND